MRVPKSQRPRQRGQAVIIAVIGLLVLAVGMYTSYNLSRAVYEKIELQNAADAAAYSLATLEARTLNFVAMANRAQVASYVQMLEVQSLLSNWSEMEGLTGFFGDFVLSIGHTAEDLEYVPYLGEVAAAIAEVLIPLGELLSTANKGLEPVVDALDEYSRRLAVELATSRAQYLFVASSMLLVGTELQLADGGWSIVTANDPRAKRTALFDAVSALNVAAFTGVIDFSSTGLTGSQEEQAAAKRIMTEMVNATRCNETGNESFIVSRPAFAGVSELLDAVLSGLEEAGGRDTGGAAGEILGGIDDVLRLFSGAHVGTAKLVTADGGGIGDLDDTGSSRPEHSDLARGGAIVAKDRLKGLFAAIDEGYFSVQSGAEHSRHCRYVRPTSNYGAAWRFADMLLRPASYGLGSDNCKSEKEDDHRWRGFLFGKGLAPYLKLDPRERGPGAQEHSFNQPDVWILLNEPPESMELGGSGDLDFTLARGAERAEMHTRPGESGVLASQLGEGINVLARAQVYYHRPGAWHEPPNLFNPFWAARLAPKSVAVSRLAEALGLSNDTLDSLIRDNVWMH